LTTPVWMLYFDVKRNEQMTVTHAANLCQALADPSRVRAAMALRAARDGRVPGVAGGAGEGKGELCACQIVALLGLAHSTVSRHLQVLRLAGLVEATKRGRWIHYRLSDSSAHPAAHRLLEAVAAGMEANGETGGDLSRLERIMAMDPEELCSLQRCGETTDELTARLAGVACCSSAPATPAGARWPKGGPACC